MRLKNFTTLKGFFTNRSHPLIYLLPKLIQGFEKGAFLLVLTFMFFSNGNAQNTPIAPATCTAGSSIYTINHQSLTEGLLPGGFCVTTEFSNNDINPSTAAATVFNGSFVNTTNIIAGGGGFTFSTDDGDSTDIKYTFCQAITNPYLFIGPSGPEIGTIIAVYEADGITPINVTLIDGEANFIVQNGNEITATTNNQSGYVQVQDGMARTTFVVEITNANNGNAVDGFDLGIGVCAPDPPAGGMTCPYDLYLWKNDKLCTPIYRDANGVFYEKDENNNNVSSLGDALFQTTPLCGTIELLEANCAIEDANCPPIFSCDVSPVEIQFHAPMGDECMFYTYWSGATAFTINNPDPLNTWDNVFTGMDAFGLPAHPSASTSSGQTCTINGLGDNNASVNLDMGGEPDEQVQMDAWIYVPNQIECLNFRVGNSTRDHSIGLYVGTDLANMALVTQENDEQAGFGDNPNGNIGSYCIPDNVSITADECGWQILRVRIYGHDDFAFYNSGIEWSFNGGLTWDDVEENYVTGATSADDNTPPTGIVQMGGGCNPIPTTIVAMDNVLVDETGKIWQVPGNCNVAPTNLYEPNIPNGMNAEEGDHLSLIPYCIVYNDNVNFTCNPCAIDVEVSGCACTDADNTFGTTNPQSVTMYNQTLIISGDINTSYTVTGMGFTDLTGPFDEMGSGGNDKRFQFKVTPGTPYEITVTGDQSGTSVTYAGLCEAPDACNCPAMPEVCGDGLDNDMDGLVDAGDPDIEGNCALDCQATPIEIQGRAMELEGFLTHQVWSRECGNTACCPSSINPHSCALAPFNCTDVNGLPQHNSACGPTNPCAPAGPPGAAGCTGNTEFRSLGSVEKARPALFSSGPEQVQLDGWLVLPPEVTCFQLKANNPRAWDGQAVYMGQGVASMNFVGANSFPPPLNYTTAAQDPNTGECIGTTQAGDVFNYDVAQGATPITVAGCTWNVIRVRAYIFDESFFHNTPVLWNIGNGFETIPSRYLQSVGAAGWDTDDNMPTAADVVETAPFCAFQDADGDIFLQNGAFYALDTRKCEQIVTNDCLDCPDNLYACQAEEGCADDVVDGNNNPIRQSPECFLKVFRVTPRTIQPIAGNGLRTVYWDHNDGNCIDNTLANQSVFCAFSEFTQNPTTCPNCLPTHPNAANPTGVVTLGTLGVSDGALPQDADNDNFVLRAINRRSGENAQQDGWLLVPPGIDCIPFRINSPTWDAGALFLGTDIDNMTFVGENINERGKNPIDTFYYEIPENVPTLACTGCVEPLRLLRVRTYHHDNNMASNTVWEWDIGNNFVNVPTENLFPAADECSTVLPSTCPTITDGTPFLAVKDAQGRFFDYNDFPATQPNNGNYAGAGILVNRIFVSGCDSLETVCEPFNADPNEVCSDDIVDLTTLDTKNICKACESDIQCKSTKVVGCSGTFTDDGSNDGNYDDAIGKELFIFCPDNPAKQQITITFTEFDLAVGDTFRIYNSDTVLTNDYVMVSGVGVGGMNGIINGHGTEPDFGAGWASATCDNATGCLTILWAPNGDNQKGQGWEFNVECEDITPKIGACTIPNFTLACDEDSLEIGKVKIPEVTSTCKENDRYIIKWSLDGGVEMDEVVLNADSICLGKVKRGAHLLSFEIVWVGEDGKPCTNDDEVCVKKDCVFGVVADSKPVCNDEIRIPLGSGCSVVVTPDDVLENPNANGDFKIKVELAEGGKGSTENITDNNTDAVIIQKEGVYKYTITDACGQACSGTIIVNDGQAPLFSTTSRDTIVNCIVAFTEAGLGLKKPEVVDNCGDATVSFISARYIRDGGSCDTSIVEVIWEAKDEAGNLSRATQITVIVRPTLLVQALDQKFECTEDDAILDDLDKTGVPGLAVGKIIDGQFKVADTVYLSTTDYICGYILNKQDIAIPSTDCGKKVYRYWELLDWCTPDNGLMARDTQFFAFTDTKAPVFDTGTATNRAIALDHFKCTYDISKTTRPSATDNCDATPTVRLDRVERIEDGEYWNISAGQWRALDCDSFRLRWVAEDLCHEQTINDTVTQIVVIKDETAPSVVTVDQINISLAHEYGTHLHINDIDAGSYDACGIASREIRIKGSQDAWDTLITITCDYVHPDLQVELRVTDKKGNQAIGWADISVEDKVDPICELEDKNVYCDEYHSGEFGAPTDVDGDKSMEDSEYLDLTDDLLAFYNKNFGVPNCDDNLSIHAGCGELTIEQQYQYIVWPCGEGKVLRRARATDWSGNQSDWTVQSITISYRANWSVTLPPDWKGQCKEEGPRASIIIENGTCDLLGYEVTEKLFEIPGDACYKIERTYHIINWCKYQAGEAPKRIARAENPHHDAAGQTITSEGYEDAGYLTYVQVLRVHDDEGPVVTIADPEPCISGIDFDAAPYGEEDITPGIAPYECDEEKTWSATAIDCSDESAITWAGRLYNEAGDIVKEVQSNTITHTVSNKDTYTAEFWAYDGCGNSGGAKGATLKFWDCKKPTPYLIHGVAVELMEGAALVQVWATDLDQGTFDNCTDQSKLELYIWHQSLGDAPTNLEHVQDLPKVINFTCSHLGTQTVNIYAVDEEGNWDYASTYVIVQDNMGTCSNAEPMSIVTGSITDVHNQSVETVKVAVNGTINNTVVTPMSGTFQFNLPMNGDYTITPEKDINPLNGVSTFDLVLISKHILGISKFNTPYKYIAADINKSGTITAFDMVQLRQLILNITDSFPQNKSWRFVSDTYEFTSNNPAGEAFPEIVTLNNVTATQMDLDFMAVKIGDVNGNAQSNNLMRVTTRNLAKDFALQVTDRLVEKGEQVALAFKSKELVTFEGYQFTLAFEGLTFTDLAERELKAENFNLELVNKGLIATSWNGATSEEELFQLTFIANQNGRLSELISISSEVTPAEAYNQTGEISEVTLNFVSETAPNFELFQNKPNPFSENTLIGFHLPEAGAASLKIMDVQGKVLKTIRRDFAKGYNQVSLNAKELGAIGIVYYQLESAANIAVKKMVILE